MTRQHISDVQLWRDGFSPEGDVEHYHRDDFCLLCGYELQGDRLYMEIHGPSGWAEATRDIDSAQPYVCMECVACFHINHETPLGQNLEQTWLSDLIKEKK